jgi:hypothetical protein
VCESDCGDDVDCLGCDYDCDCDCATGGWKATGYGEASPANCDASFVIPGTATAMTRV